MEVARRGSRGVRDKFYEFTQDNRAGRCTATRRCTGDTWSKQERDEKTKTYGGSRANPDYKRNIYGEHGDATNPLFVLARLMACVDLDRRVSTTRTFSPTIRLTTRSRPSMLPAAHFVQLPASHKMGWGGNTVVTRLSTPGWTSA